MTNQEAIAKVATAKVIDDKAYKVLSAELPSGITTINHTIQIVGGLKKGEPFEQRVAAAANPWALLARALSKLNTASIEAIVRESLSVDEAETEAIKQAAADAIEKIVGATKRQMSGKVTATLEWRLLA